MLLLKKLPPFDDFLCCGISTQLKQEVKDFDMIIDTNNPAFGSTGLIQSSLIRLSFLALVPLNKIIGKIGNLDLVIHKELLNRLAKFLLQ